MENSSRTIFRKYFLLFLIATFCLTTILILYTFYFKYQNKTRIDKKISTNQNIYFLLVSNSDDKKNVISLLCTLFPKEKKVAFYFINPMISLDEVRIENLSNPQAVLKEKLENLLDKKISYTFSIKENDFSRIIDIFGGLEIFIDPSVNKSISNNKHIEEYILKFSGSELLDFLKLKSQDNPYDYIDRLNKQETILLNIFDKINANKKVFKKEWIYFVANFFDTNLSIEEIYYLYQYFTENNFVFSISEMPSEIINSLKSKQNKAELKINEELVSIAYNKFEKDLKSDDYGDGEFARIEILNATETVGLAKRAKSFLNDKRIKILSTDNSGILNVNQSIIIDKSGNSVYVKKVSEYLGITNIRHALNKDSGLDLTIILGEDFDIKNEKK